MLFPLLATVDLFPYSIVGDLKFPHKSQVTALTASRGDFAYENVAFIVLGDHATRAPYDVVRRSRRRDFAQLNISD
ncbi:hypothetical protein TIFTF001_013492 [Ficus carica]|uniref:Uncharacterized protein n=1 Tax=Ficus carica TaxID=3494 RepID=A0AA88AED6_FICCA|nr:hypothetical protein TIFTF001_013492 [Ficus carica]